MKNIVIIGGGLTGLVTAERLNDAGFDAVVFEAESEVGGACRSFERDGFTFDYTGHLLHVNRPETRSYFENLGVWSDLTVHERRAAIDVGGFITPYPIQINTFGLADEVRRDCVLGFVRAWAARGVEPPGNFRQWVLDRFGRGFAEHFFFPYNSKLYRAEPEELSLDWVGRYVPKPKLDDVVDGAFGLYETPVGYNATFRYPSRGGIRLLSDAVARGCTDIRLDSRVSRIHLTERWVETDGGERCPYDELVFTGALNRLASLIADPRPDGFDAATADLRSVQVVNIALGVRGPAPRSEHWLYFPDSDVPFYRLGIPSNHGRLAPPGHHTLSVEISLDSGAGDCDDLLAAAEAHLVATDLLRLERVVVREVVRIDPAYVVFDHQRRPAVASLRRACRRHGIHLAGRWAEWKYSAMEDAVLDGMRVARSIARRPE